MCVLEILVLKIFFGLRDNFERFLCWLDHWFSCMLDCIHICVFHISKNCFDKLSRHLLDTLLSVELLKYFLFFMQSRHLIDTWWIDRESSCLLDSSSTPDGSIELLFLNLTLCCSIPQLSKTRSSTPTLLASSIPPDTSAIEHYWRVYIFLNHDSSLISSISLNLSVTVHLPNTLLFTPNLFLKDSSSFFKFLFTW